MGIHFFFSLILYVFTTDDLTAPAVAVATAKLKNVVSVYNSWSRIEIRFASNNKKQGVPSDCLTLPSEIN